MIIKRIFFIILISAALTVPAGTAPSGDYEKIWGTGYRPFMQSIPKHRKVVEFKTSEKPGYKNRIINFIASISPDSRSRFKILRVSGNPDCDYLFFKNRLYSVTENWGTVDISTASELRKNMIKSFGRPETEKKGMLTIFTYQRNRTKIILYHKRVDEARVKMRLYAYSLDLFNCLFSE